ncbi:MAG TPA: TIGR03560 family F420-dependent LLM class oxidoreductase [Methylomirabilota bacterium]|nr:TIGR03560 family F420-dependent LLM class oxidoreductase [Methylomirabilota bacterium]
MRVGVMIEGQEGLTWERWLRLAEAAEDMGYDSLCRSDHLTGLWGESKRPSLETWTSLTVLAMRTRRIRFGPLVSPITFYQPALLAKMAVALDTLSGGRMDLGLGAGWNEHEHAMFGIPLPPVKERLDRLEAAARYIRALGVGEPVTLEQPFYPLRKAENYPLPTHGRLRLVIGGRGEQRTLRIAAEFADEWNVTRVDPAGFRHKREVLAKHCVAVRRDPETIARSLMIPLAIGRDRADVAQRIAAARAVFPQMPDSEAAWREANFLVGTPDEVVASLREWDAAGVQRVMLQMLDQEDLAALELFARHVLPHVK